MVKDSLKNWFQEILKYISGFKVTHDQTVNMKSFQKTNVEFFLPFHKLFDIFNLHDQFNHVKSTFLDHWNADDFWQLVDPERVDFVF